MINPLDFASAKRVCFKMVLMTLSAMVGAVIAISLIPLPPATLSFFGMEGVVNTIVMYLRWPLLALDAVYRFRPSRGSPPGIRPAPSIRS
jgi:hypothetical protein